MCYERELDHEDACCLFFLQVFFFKQKTAYEMRISDWSSDVCSSDLRPPAARTWLTLGVNLISSASTSATANESPLLPKPAHSASLFENVKEKADRKSVV